MPLLDITHYAPYIHRILSGEMKPVAYGVNVNVNLIYPLRPAYFISEEAVEQLPENARKFWKQESINKLRDEDPAKTVIIVCKGNEEEVWKIVSVYGDFPVLRFFSYEFLAPYLPALANIPKTYERQPKKDRATRAIVIRGNIRGENSFHAIAKISSDHPSDIIIVSTWDDVSPHELFRLEALCDRVVLSKKPLYAGRHNRNYQITLAQNGMKAAFESGALKCLICRTDTLFAKSSTLDGFDWLMNKFPLASDLAHFQKERLIIPDIFTRRFIPYHGGDLFTYGRIEDVSAFWNASPPDDRQDDSPLYLERGMQTSLQTCVKNKVIVETYFWINYLERIGRHQLYTLADWLQFLRDCVLVTTMHEQRILWTSKDFYDHTVLARRYKTCLNFADWAQLSYERPNLSTAIDLNEAVWQDYVNSS